jgi:hypothetical protein
MDIRWGRPMAVGLTILAMGAGCARQKAPEWRQISQGDPCAGATTTPCDAGTFYLDTANISRNAGTPYIILQTRYADGRVGAIRAEVNCPRRKVEPTALQEAVYKDGALVTNRMTNLSGDDERGLLAVLCDSR